MFQNKKSTLINLGKELKREAQSGSKEESGEGA